MARAPSSTLPRVALPLFALSAGILLLAGAARADEAKKQGRRVVSIREALQLAAKQGPDVAAARAQAAVAEAGVQRARTVWHPEITGTVTYDHTSAPSEFDVAGLANLFAASLTPAASIAPGAHLPSATTIVGANSLYGTLQITQPLFTPQGLHLVDIAKLASEAAARGSDEAREQVLLAVARAYFSLQGVQGLAQAAKDLEGVSLRREEEAKAQIRAGTAVELTLLRAQTDTANARAQIANLDGTRESLLPLLEALVGEAIEPQPFGGESGLPQLADAGAEPWESSHGVQSAAAAVRAQAEALDLDKQLWLPTVAGVLKGNYNSNAGFAGTTATWDLILTASIPLYDRGTRYAAKAEDEAKLRQALANLASVRAKARAAWLGARANLLSAQAALAQSEAQVQFASRAQAQVDSSYKAGVATSLDLTDADNKKFTAQSAAAQARAQVDLRRAEVTAAEGKLFDAIGK
jgi:outer membrane protein TolC